MSLDDDMRERHGRVLAELAETGMVMVRRLSDAMLRTHDVQTQAQIGLAYHRVSRAVRQTLALEFRLSQDARRDVASARPAPAPGSKPAAPPRAPTERTGWTEYERNDSDEALDDLDALLDADDVDLDAAQEAVEACIANIRRDLDVDPSPLGLQPASHTFPAFGGAEPTEDWWRRPEPTAAHPDPSDRRSRLMGGVVLPPPVIALPRPPPLTWRSSA